MDPRVADSEGDSDMGLRQLLVRGAAAATLIVGVATTLPAQASSRASGLDPVTLARAQTIRVELDARYRLLPDRKLAVTEATPTGVIESFTLLTADLLESRVVDAANGVYYAICPLGAACPYPARRFARPAEDLVPRRLALELAVRTFLETTADVVAVSLPTPRFIVFIVEREELERDVDAETLAKALSASPSRGRATSVGGIVDRATRSRIFLFLGLAPTPSGRETWAGMARWLSGRTV